MGGYRIPGGIGIGVDLHIDRGTSIRAASLPPGPTGVDDVVLRWTRTALRRGVREGLSLASDMIVSVALRELRELEGDVEAQMRFIARLPTEARDEVAYQTFAAGFDHYLPQKFLHQYVKGGGAELKLSEKEMIDCNAYITLVGNKSFQSQLDLATAKPGTAVPLNLSVPAGALTNGTLGNFTVKIQGTLTAAPTGAWAVQGQMSFYDKWDFDPKDFDKGNRSTAGELKTRFANAFLPGTAFVISSETVPFKQSQADRTVVWAGGTPAGVPDRVSKVDLIISAPDR